MYIPTDYIIGGACFLLGFVLGVLTVFQLARWTAKDDQLDKKE